MDTDGTKVIQFGKYRGKRFDIVYEDKEYCHWLLKTFKTKKVNLNIDLFIKYIQKIDKLKNRKYDSEPIKKDFNLEYNLNKRKALNDILNKK